MCSPCYPPWSRTPLMLAVAPMPRGYGSSVSAVGFVKGLQDGPYLKGSSDGTARLTVCYFLQTVTSMTFSSQRIIILTERYRALDGVWGSWGLTLALAYSQTHPERVTELVLRGIFLLRQREIAWFYQQGASALYPDAWEPYWNHIPEERRGDMLGAYHRRLTSEDSAVRHAAAKIWSGWEGATSKLMPDAAFTAHYEEDEFALAFARIEAHYFVNKGFFESDAQLLENAFRIRHIPGVIVQGRYDVVCPMESAWALHRAWPEAELLVTADSGHSAFDPPNSRALVAATDRFTGDAK